MQLFDLPPISTLTGDALNFHHCRFLQPDHSTALMGIKDIAFPLPIALFRTSPKRQAEFMAGRYCAHRAAAALNCPLGFLAIKDDRSPGWPSSLVGSITHTAGIAGCVAGLTSHYRGLGVDMEWLVTKRSAEALRSQILTAEDLRLLASMINEIEGLTLIFSAKEAIYKAIHPTVKRFVDFKEVSCLARHADYLLFGYESDLKDELVGIETIRVNYQISNGLVTTWCVLV